MILTLGTWSMEVQTALSIQHSIGEIDLHMKMKMKGALSSRNRYRILQREVER
ncbi:hypothetical protein K443DRAFT_681859 [Laccaria amethystina LaAM-08-1]|uniref:Uncharacterized protein n=1 Tax=Laccaria amethystina LaAM-08-1 TaxID=1095629 RepID=A0A0C9WL81_9AGAR|nr:hypothetical protein K443DRAFT_681859 [Laccaria amethystina LaAM-08-1]